MKEVEKGIAPKGFSKLSKQAKIEWLVNNYLEDEPEAIEQIKRYWNPDAQVQNLHDEFIENTLSNHYFPWAIAPNFNINGKNYCIPMAIEESSVVAAASKSANFWRKRGGFKAQVLGKTKIGHIHFIWKGDVEEIRNFIGNSEQAIKGRCSKLTKNMEARGGGILSIGFNDKTESLNGYCQLEMQFDTCDSMGANFINSILEETSTFLKEQFGPEKLDVVMCILSNYNPESIVRAEVSCDLEELVIEDEPYSAQVFAERFIQAINIAQIEPYRASTHNKGIMNGVDAVVIATGNDFRAVEAGVHTYASRSGQYRSLSNAQVVDGQFRFWLDLPLSIGTVGGLTKLHPLVALSLQILGNPNSDELMGIIACAGLAQNFGALRSLVTSGIQKGHMKMHLLNILNQLEANAAEKKELIQFFKDKVPSHSSVVEAFCQMRGISSPQKQKKN